MDQVDPRWRKASYSGNGANCIEAGHAPGVILVRDTTNRHGVTLSVPAEVGGLHRRTRRKGLPWQGCLGRLERAREDRPGLGSEGQRLAIAVGGVPDHHERVRRDFNALTAG